MNATTPSDGASPEERREAMIARIKERGYGTSEPVERALRAVERHAFVPGAPLADAYGSRVVVTKRGPEYQALGCLSEPEVVALQLEQLDVRPGHRVLEIGTGTGYPAALLARLVGPEGRVTTIDVDGDVVADARRNLRAAGFDAVQVGHGDGALSHQEGAP